MNLKTVIASFCAVSLTSVPGWAESAKAFLAGTQVGSIVSGVVMLQDTPMGLKVDVDITQAPAGEHGFHIHEFGFCDDAGKGAGGHYNPEGHPHGNMIKDGIAKTHAGDLGNIAIAANRKGSLHTVVPGLTLTGDKGVAGRTFVLHEKADDFSQPLGNAGNRIGCGPILIAKP